MKNILIPTDFSENAWNAIQYALTLFKEEECRIHLLNTYTPAIASSRFMAASVESGMFENTAKTISAKGLKKLVDRIKRDFKNPKHSFKVTSSYSFLVDEIKEVLETEEIDFIVMGTKGASGLKEVFMGTNAVRVINAIRNCPVLVIPENFCFSKATQIAFATDYKRSYDAEMLQPLKQMASNFDATIRIMHITEEKELNKFQEANMYILDEYMHILKHTLHWVPSFASKSEVIGQFLEDMNVDMLAMVNFEHSPLAQLMREPVIKHLAFHIHIPLLVLPEFGLNEISRTKKTKRGVLNG